MNIIIAILAVMVAADWTGILEPRTAATLVAVASMAKLVINAIRDGLAGMVKTQPPVS
jgi:hypothetical protein